MVWLGYVGSQRELAAVTRSVSVLIPARRPGLDPASAQNRSWYPEDHASRTVWFKQVPELYGKDSYSADMVLKVGPSLAPRVRQLCVKEGYNVR